MSTCKEIIIDGVKYVREDSQTKPPPPPSGKRAVLVLDRGWIVAGDVEDVIVSRANSTLMSDRRIKVTRAVHVRSWSEIGFDGMIASPKSSKVVLKPIPNGFDCPADAELFRVQVSDDWGL